MILTFQQLTHRKMFQGEKVSIMEGVRHQYRLKLTLGKEHLPWRTQIVMSTLPIAHLPRSMKWEGVKPVCTVESRLNPADMKLKNRHWQVLACHYPIRMTNIENRYNFGPQYQRADFYVKILLGPADLKFQMWGKNGQLNKNHDEIEVQWNPLPVSPSTDSGSREEYGMYRF